jgi:hypothetical protein
VLTLFSYLFFILILLELIIRIFYHRLAQLPQVTAGVQFVNYLRGKGSAFTGPIESRPYSLYWNRPNHVRKGFKQTDANGFRFKGYDVLRAKSSKRILCYGGSTTYSDHVFKNPSDCWPHLLENRLKASYQDFEVVNCGLNYAMTTELVSHLIFEGVHFNPDFVILHGPGNDLLPVAIGDQTLDYRNTRKSTNLQARFFEPVLLNIFCSVRLIYARMLRENTFAELEPPIWPSPDTQNLRLLNNPLTSFKSNVRTFVDVCVSRGIKVVLVNFVQNHEEQLEMMRPGLSSGMLNIVARMNDYFNELARQNPTDVLHVNLVSVDFSPTDFVDICHLNQVGEIKKADLIFSGIFEFVTKK